MIEKANDHKQNREQDKADELWNVIKNTRGKIERYRKEAENIDQKIQSLLSE